MCNLRIKKFFKIKAYEREIQRGGEDGSSSVGGAAYYYYLFWGGGGGGGGVEIFIDDTKQIRETPTNNNIKKHLRSKTLNIKCSSCLKYSNIHSIFYIFNIQWKFRSFFNMLIHIIHQ
jgi:hypothetical protein